MYDLQANVKPLFTGQERFMSDIQANVVPLFVGQGRF